MASRAWAGYVAPSTKPPPELVPIFGSQLGWGPGRTCRDIHPGGPIPPGSRLVCMACHGTGVESLVARHTKPGDGQDRKGWVGATPTQVPELPPEARQRAEEPRRRQLRGGRS